MSKKQNKKTIPKLSEVNFILKKGTGRSVAWKSIEVVTRRLMMSVEEKTESEGWGGGGAEDCLDSAEAR